MSVIAFSNFISANTILADIVTNWLLLEVDLRYDETSPAKQSIISHYRTIYRTMLYVQTLSTRIKTDWSTDNCKEWSI